MSFISSILGAASLLLGDLSQIATNGLSLWGTFGAPQLPFFLPGHPHGPFPWSPFGINDSPNLHVPNTGFTRTYDWTISRGYIAPDGVNKSVILINGQFPGPLLEANWGDQIEVTVRNSIANEGTTIHWHGLLQTGTPEMDGVPGGSQCPVAPGQVFTYKFTADQYGTSWYHSHYSSQYSGGLYGPIVIYGPLQVSHDIDLGPVMVQDWYHEPYFEALESDFVVPLNPLPPSNNLINGKMYFNCSAKTVDASCTPNAGISKFSFKTGKTHRLRLINSGSDGMQKFSIDDHTLTVIAVDFVPVVPYNTTVVTLGVGQRTDVLVKATGKPGEAYWMRSNFSQLCAAPPSLQPYALAAIYYPGANQNARPTSMAYSYTQTDCLNDPLDTTTPWIPMTLPSNPQAIQTININYTVNGSGVVLFTFGGISFKSDYNKPVLLLESQKNCPAPSYDPDWNVYNFGKNTSIRLILTNSVPQSHPMHLHGHTVWVLAEGNGEWDGTITNPNNPIRRDTVQMGASNSLGSSYIVLQWEANNPGVWPLHCHVAGHASTGLFLYVLERPDLIPSLSLSPQIEQTCTAWDAWSSKNVVDEIDSGV